MRTPAIQVYALAVCFCTLVCFVIALGVGLYDVVQITAPQFTLQQWYSHVYGSNEQFVATYPDKKGLPADEIKRLREQASGDALTGERRAAEQSEVFVLIILAIDSAVFAVHWRIAQRVGYGTVTV